ncbi:hypothetical protein HHI36_023665 [Cryptolaemus montrouzieri]|uniref:Uncharacterized protein n=1 Tax=Cryptolaemus montrouzieri TaxID=559131 RepID=A0ABD2PID4_9CUCU
MHIESDWIEKMHNLALLCIHLHPIAPTPFPNPIQIFLRKMTISSIPDVPIQLYIICEEQQPTVMYTTFYIVDKQKEQQGRDVSALRYSRHDISRHRFSITFSNYLSSP